jgi:hypothetical protein
MPRKHCDPAFKAQRHLERNRISGKKTNLLGAKSRGSRAAPDQLIARSIPVSLPFP